MCSCAAQLQQRRGVSCGSIAFSGHMHDLQVQGPKEASKLVPARPCCRGISRGSRSPHAGVKPKLYRPLTDLA